MTNFNWVVTSLYTQTIDGEQNYVVVAQYDVIGIDGNYTAKISSLERFSTSTVTPFIPYEDLTNEIVIGWIQQQLGADGVANTCASVQGSIDAQINPPSIPQNTPLPWGSTNQITPTKK